MIEVRLRVKCAMSTCRDGAGAWMAEPTLGRPWLSVVEPLWLRRLFALRVHQLVRDGKALVVGWLVFAFRLPPVRGEPGARPVELSRVMLPSHCRGALQVGSTERKGVGEAGMREQG